MFYYLLDFFYKLFNWVDTGNDAIGDPISDFMSAPAFTSDPGSTVVLNWQSYLSLICSLIALVFIVVLCCLFVWKIIKLVGGLIR